MAEVEREFLQAAATVLQTEQGYYPTAVALPALDRGLTEFETRLVQFDTYGTPFVIVMTPMDAEKRREFTSGKLREHYLETIRRALEEAGTKGARVSVVLIGEEKLRAREAKHCLRRTELGRRPLREVGFYWATPRAREFQSGYRFLSLAPNRALNPCYPEQNTFTRLMRRGWEKVGQVPTGEHQEKGWQAEKSFSERLLGQPTAFWVVLVINLLVWYLTERLGGSRNLEVLIRCGAKVDGLIRAGEWWRLVTASFLHAGYVHMALNGLGLLVVGQTLERLYGTPRFVVVYVVCGAAAGLASMAVSHGVMVGASGAIFGLVGVLIAYGFRYRRDIPGKYQAMFGAGLLPLVGLNVVLGLMVPQVDNAAHIGGLVAGFALGMVLRPRTSPGTRRWAWWVRRTALVVSVGVVAASGYMAVQFYRDYPTIGKVDLRFVSERKMGPVKIAIPSTWTVRQVSREKWTAATTYCTAGVDIIHTPNPIQEALRRTAVYFTQEGKVPAGFEFMLLEEAERLRATGRVSLGIVTYVIVPGGVAELVTKPTGGGHVSGEDLGELLRRMDESFQRATEQH